MSKITSCLWSNGKAEEAANFYVSLLPDSRITKVQRSVMDYPGGKAGSVLLVEFTLAGQSFMVLNGGMDVEYTHAVSFSVEGGPDLRNERLIWIGQFRLRLGKCRRDGADGFTGAVHGCPPSSRHQSSPHRIWIVWLEYRARSPPWRPRV